MIYDIELNSAAHCPADGIIKLAPAIEAAGFGAIWKGESNSNDPIVLLSGIAACTRTLLVGTAVYHLYGRSPITLGIQAATLQDLSGGRLRLGLGVGNGRLANWHGSVFDRPLKRMREYIDIVRSAAAGERVEYEGEIYATGERFQLAWKPNHPKLQIYLAALAPKMIRLAGKIADGIIINMATPAKVREISQGAMVGAAEAGRNPKDLEIIVKVRCSLNPDRSKARSGLRQVLTFYNIAEYYCDLLRASGFASDVDAVQQAHRERGFKAAVARVTDEYMDRLPVVPATSVGEIKERLVPFIEAGATRLVIPYVPAIEPMIEDARRFVEAWAAKS